MIDAIITLRVVAVVVINTYSNTGRHMCQVDKIAAFLLLPLLILTTVTLLLILLLLLLLLLLCIPTVLAVTVSI
jgi:hypothetical protein